MATLQKCQAGPAPVLIRIETRSGHGSSNLTKGIEVTADSFSFFLYNTGAKIIY
jgi:prolyl oligopeptidase